MGIKSYKDLNIWQRGRELVKITYATTQEFPRQELYGLTSQLRRATVSIPTNISEGFARGHRREYKQFLYIALGSCAETDTLFILSNDLGYLNESKLQKMQSELDILARMISTLIGRLQ